MLAKVIFVAILVSAGTALPVRMNKNDVIDSVMQDYRKIILNDTFADLASSCCPVIDSSESTIRPITGYRGEVTLIVNYGNCPANSTNSFECCVTWGDTSPLDCDYTNDVGPCHKVHQYPQVDQAYTIFASYYNDYRDNLCGDIYFRTIDITA